MQVTPSSTVVGVFRSQSAVDQATEALYTAGFECKQMRDMIANTSSGFFDDLKSFFKGAAANTSQTEDDASNPLVALGLSREAAHYYSDEYSKGNPVLIVNAQGREQEILTMLSLYGAYNAQIKSVDQAQLLTSASQNNSSETSVSLSNTQSGESYPQAQTSDEIPIQERSQDTELFGTLENSSTANFTDDQALYPIPADQTTPANSWDSETPLPESAASDMPLADRSTPVQQEESPITQTSAETSENDDEAFETPEVQADRSAPGQGEELPVIQDNIDTAENDVSELDQPEIRQEEEASPVGQDDSDTAENDVSELDQPALQADINASNHEIEKVDEWETPVMQTNGDDSENGIAESDVQALQSDVNSYQVSQAEDDISTQETDVESSSQNAAAFEHAEELQRLQEQIKLTQQQLESAKTSLDAIKERERQYKKRQKQLQNTRKQLQDLQIELQATQTELQETEMRVASYQNVEMEDSFQQLEKQKKAKKQKKSAAFSTVE